MHALKSRRFLIVATSLVVLAVIAAVAYAFWSATATGSGSATTDNPGAQTVSISQSTAPTGLYPSSSIALSGTLTNNNTNPVHVNSVTASVVSVDAAHATAGCNASDYSITGTSSIGGSGSIAGNGGTQSWNGLSLAMANTGSNQDACKGATVNLSYSVN